MKQVRQVRCVDIYAAQDNMVMEIISMIELAQSKLQYVDTNILERIKVKLMRDRRIGCKDDIINILNLSNEILKYYRGTDKAIPADKFIAKYNFGLFMSEIKDNLWIMGYSRMHNSCGIDNVYITDNLEYIIGENYLPDNDILKKIHSLLESEIVFPKQLHSKVFDFKCHIEAIMTYTEGKYQDLLFYNVNLYDKTYTVEDENAVAAYKRLDILLNKKKA